MQFLSNIGTLLGTCYFQDISLDPEKIRAIMEWAALRNVDEVRSFMGLEGYYERFIRNFSQTAYPITSLQRQGKKFEWTH